MNFYLNHLTTFTFRGELSKEGWDLVQDKIARLFDAQGFYPENVSINIQNVRTYRGLESVTAIQVYASRYCSGKFEDRTRELLEQITRDTVHVQSTPF